MIDHIAKERTHQDDVIKTIVTQNHPVFEAIRSQTKTPYRVFFTTRDEMKAWLRGRNWKEIEDEEDIFGVPYHRWRSEQRTKTDILNVNSNLFDEDGRLKPIDQKEWDKEDWLHVEEGKKKGSEYDDLDDEIPF